MHLQAQGLGRGDDLRQVRQGRPKRVEQASAEGSLGVLADVLGEGLPARQQRGPVRVGAKPHLGYRVVPGGGPQELGDRVRGAPRVSFRPADQSFHRWHPIGIGHAKTRGRGRGPIPSALASVRRRADQRFRAPRGRRGHRRARAARRRCRSPRRGPRP